MSFYKPLLLFSFLVLCEPLLANSPYPDANCPVIHVNFKYNYKVEDFKTAAIYWRNLIVECPSYSESQYLEGEKVYLSFLNGDVSYERREQIIDTLILIQDLRMEYFGKIGFLEGKKGVLLTKYRPQQKIRAYQCFEKSVDLEKEKSKSSTLNAYFKTVVRLGLADSLSDAEVLFRFEKIMDIVDKNPEETKALRKNIRIYGKKYLTREKVIPWKEFNFPVFQDSIPWLERSLLTLTISGNAESPIADKIAEQLHQLSPASISAYSLGLKAYQKGKFEVAKTYFKEALDLCGSDSARIQFYFKLAEISWKQTNYIKARSYLLKIIEIDPENARAYELLGGVYSDFANNSGLDEFGKGAIYWIAVDMLNKALQQKPSNTPKIQVRISKLEANFPKKKDIFFRGLKEGEEFSIKHWINKLTRIRARQLDQGR